MRGKRTWHSGRKHFSLNFEAVRYNCCNSIPWLAALNFTLKLDVLWQPYTKLPLPAGKIRWWTTSSQGFISKKGRLHKANISCGHISRRTQRLVCHHFCWIDDHIRHTFPCDPVVVFIVENDQHPLLFRFRSSRALKQIWTSGDPNMRNVRVDCKFVFLSLQAVSYICHTRPNPCKSADSFRLHRVYDPGAVGGWRLCDAAANEMNNRLNARYIIHSEI